MEPPTKKLRPYVTKFQRKQAEQHGSSAASPASMTRKVPTFEKVNHKTETQQDLKSIFISDETVLDYQDRNYKSILPRKEARSVHVGESPGWCIRWCPKFSHLLAACCENNVKLYNVLKNEKISNVHTMKHAAHVKHCDWSRTSRQLLTCSFDGTVNMFDFLDQGKIAETLKVETQPSLVRWWKGEDDLILVGGEKSFLASYDIRSGKEVCKYNFKCGKILSVDFFTNSTSFVASSDEVNRQSAEHNLIVWDLRTGAKLSRQIFHERYTCPCVRVHPSGANFLAQTTGNYIARFSTQAPYRLDKFVRYQNHTVNEYPVAFDVTQDGHYVVAGSSTGAIVCYKHTNGNYLRTVPLLQREESACVDVQCHPVIPGVVAASDWSGVLHVLT